MPRSTLFDPVRLPHSPMPMPSNHLQSPSHFLGLAGLLSWFAVVGILLPGCSSNDRDELTTQERLGLYLEGALGYYEAGNLDVAQQQVEFGLRLDPDNERFLLLLGNIHQQRGTTVDIQMALGLFRDHPAQDDYRVRLGLAQALERMGVIYDDAADAIRSGDRETEAPDPAKRAEELAADAVDSWNESYDLYRATLEIHSGEMGAIGGLLRVCALLGKDAESVQWGREMISVLESASRIRRLEMEDASIAASRERQLRDAIADNQSTIVQTHLHISSLQRKLGLIQQAIDELGAVIELDPNLPQAHSRQAQLYYELAQYQRAKDTVQRFLKLSAHLPFDHPDIRQAYTLLRRCKTALSGTDLLGAGE